MASANRCSACPKGAGTCHCPGCNAYFCDKDFRNHRVMLVNGLEELIAGRNELQQKVSQANPTKHSGSSLLSRIDAWQEETIFKVKQAADQARQETLEIINAKHEDINKQFQSMSQELQQLQYTKDVLEGDLSRLKNQIEQVNSNLEKLSQSPIVELNMKQSERVAWNRLIYVEDRSASSPSNQQGSKTESEYYN